MSILSLRIYNSQVSFDITHAEMCYSSVASKYGGESSLVLMALDDVPPDVVRYAISSAPRALLSR